MSVQCSVPGGIFNNYFLSQVQEQEPNSDGDDEDTCRSNAVWYKFQYQKWTGAPLFQLSNIDRYKQGVNFPDLGWYLLKEFRQ